jgi:putative membrane protein
MLQTKTESKSIWVIGILSIVIPILVGILLFMPEKINIPENWIRTLPHLNGILNTGTALALILGFIAVKKKDLLLHRNIMISAFILGSIFLVSYVIYHSGAESTIYGDLNRDGILSESEREILGSKRIIYLIILLSHIALATIVVPFVLLALFYAYSNNFIKHRKIVKFTLPIWFYVSVSGVVVYLMISPYY